jgi:hypothetical protein
MTYPGIRGGRGIEGQTQANWGCFDSACIFGPDLPRPPWQWGEVSQQLAG